MNEPTMDLNEFVTMSRELSEEYRTSRSRLWSQCGQAVRRARLARDLSLRELARQVGRSAAFICDIEMGRRFPSEQTMRRITKTLASIGEGPPE